MGKEHAVGKVAAVIATVGLAFWAGRTTSPERLVEVNLRSTKTSDRSAARVARERPAGAGAGAVSSTVELRRVLKNGGEAGAQAALSKMNSSELAALVEDLANSQAAVPGYVYKREISVAMGRWAEIDPNAAFKFVINSKDVIFRQAAIQDVMATIAKTDPALARAKIATVGDVQLRTAGLSVCVSALGEHPNEWMDFIKDHPQSVIESEITSQFGEWAADDPVAAAARVLQLPAQSRGKAAAQVAQIWAAKDGTAALAWAESIPGASDRGKAIAAAIGGMATHDPDGALTALGSQNLMVRRAGLESIFKTLAVKDFDAALERASALTDAAERAIALRALLPGYRYVDSVEPERSGSQLDSVISRLPPGGLRETALGALGSQLASYTASEARALLEHYSKADQQKMLEGMNRATCGMALTWYGEPQEVSVEKILEDSSFADTIPKEPAELLKEALSLPQEEKEKKIAGILEDLASVDPAAACGHLEELPAGSELRSDAVSSITSSWMKVDPDAARAWAEGLQGGERTEAMEAVVEGLVEVDMVQAVLTLQPLLTAASESERKSLNNVAHNLVVEWAGEDPAAAGAWLLGFADESIREQLSYQFLRTWSNTDPSQLELWMGSLPGGQGRDQMVESYVDFTSRKDPAKGFQWAASVGDPSRRLEALSDTIDSWKNKDVEAARAAINSATLPPAERAALLKRTEPSQEEDPFRN